MGSDEGISGAEVSAAGGSPKVRRRSQVIARGQRRRRRPNIDPAESKHTLELTVSGSEWAQLKAAAAENGSTIPWYVLQCALYPVAPRSGETGESTSGPWLPWPKRQGLQWALLSATAALDEIRLQELAHMGANLNQIAHSANVTGVLADDIDDTLAQWRETMEVLRATAAEVQQLAKDVTRR